MTTNLLIGRPYIGRKATLTGSISADASYPFTNSVMGGRADRVKFGSAATEPYIKHDLGASLTSAVEFLFVAKANLLKAKGAIRLTLSSSSDDASYTSRLGTTAALSTRTYSGPRSEDLIFTSAFNDDVTALNVTAYRYWRLYTGNSGSSKVWEFGKAMFGPWFDMGRDPSFVRPIARDKNDPSERRAGIKLSLEWVGITDAVRNSFFAEIVNYKDIMPIVLYTVSYHDILNEHRTLYGKITKASFKYLSTNSNRVTIDFEELI
jgi:hypothetical protein